MAPPYSRYEIPALHAEPLPWNLVEVAEDVTPSGDKWLGGTTWTGSNHVKARMWDPWDDTPEQKNLSIDLGIGGIPALVLYLPYACATSGTPTDEDVQTAKKNLEAATAAGVEAVFWDWAFDAAGAVGVTGDAISVVAALGQHLADDGLAGQGMIHMPPWAAEFYLSASGFDASGTNAPRTNRGDKISVGAGYGSVGAANTRQAVISSGPVGVLLSDIEILESNETIVSTNQRVILAERYVAIQADESLLSYGFITKP